MAEPSCHCQTFVWCKPANAESKNQALTEFGKWYGRNRHADGYSESSLSNLYGTPMLDKLGRVFAAGYIARRRVEGKCICMFDGCWEKLQVVQAAHPDLFRSYAFDAEHCKKTLETIYLLGWFSN